MNAFKNSLVAIAAAATLGATALASTQASAAGYGYGYGYNSYSSYAPSYGYSSYTPSYGYNSYSLVRLQLLWPGLRLRLRPVTSDNPGFLSIKVGFGWFLDAGVVGMPTVRSWRPQSVGGPATFMTSRGHLVFAGSQKCTGKTSRSTPRALSPLFLITDFIGNKILPGSRSGATCSCHYFGGTV